MKNYSNFLKSGLCFFIIMCVMPLFAQNDLINLSSQVSNQREVLDRGWTKYEIPNTLTIEIPPTMEVADGAYKSLTKNLANVMLNCDINTKSIVFHQADLNTLNRNAMRRYARIIINAKQNREFAELISRSSLEPELLKEIETETYNMLKEGFSQNIFAPKIIKWHPIEQARLGGLNGYKISFIRQLESSPPVYVEEYTLGYGRKIYSVTLSYRKNEEAFWKDDYERVKRNLKFSKTR